MVTESRRGCEPIPSSTWRKSLLSCELEKLSCIGVKAVGCAPHPVGCRWYLPVVRPSLSGVGGRILGEANLYGLGLPLPFWRGGDALSSRVSGLSLSVAWLSSFMATI